MANDYKSPWVKDSEEKNDLPEGIRRPADYVEPKKAAPKRNPEREKAEWEATPENVRKPQGVDLNTFGLRDAIDKNVRMMTEKEMAEERAAEREKRAAMLQPKEQKKEESKVVSTTDNQTGQRSSQAAASASVKSTTSRQPAETKSMNFTVLNGQEMREKIKDFINTDSEMLKSISPEGREELNRLFNNPKTAEEMKSKMFLIADTGGQPTIHPLTMQESIKLNMLEGQEREKYAASLIEKDLASPKSQLEVAKIVDNLNSDYGNDIIARQGVAGHQLQVSNIHVHDQEKLFDGMVSRFAPGADVDSQRADMKDKYLMTAVVDGQNVQKHITRQQFDEFSALPQDQKLAKFNEIFGIQYGNSIAVADKQQANSQDIKINSQQAGNDVKAILAGKDWYQRMTANGYQPTLENVRISKEADGTAYMTVAVNGEDTKTRITDADYSKLLASREPGQDIARQQNNVYQVAQSPMELLLQLLANLLGFNFFNSASTAQQAQQQQRTAPNVADRKAVIEGQGLEPVLRTHASELAAANFEQLDMNNRETGQTVHRGMGL